MQDRIIVDFNALSRISRKLRSAGQEMDEAMAILSGLYLAEENGSDLRLYGCNCSLKTVGTSIGAHNVSSAVSNYRTAIRRLGDYSQSLSVAVSDLADDFRRMESGIAGDTGTLPQSGNENSNHSDSSDIPDFFFLLPLFIPHSPFFSWVVGPGSNTYDIFGPSYITTSGTVSSRIFETKTGGNTEWDFTNGDAGMNGYAKMSGNYWKADGELKIGDYSKSKGSISFLNIETKAEGGINIMRDGKFEPGIQFGLGATGSVLELNGESQMGTDAFNQHVNAKGELLGGELGISGGVGVITTEDGDKEIGARVSAGAEAYVAKGEIKGGYTICGIDIDFVATGKALAIGATADASITQNGVSGKIGASALFGGEIGIEIDWSDFEVPDFDDIDFPDFSGFILW